MEAQGKKAMKNLLCAAIVVEGSVVGALTAINKTVSGINTPRDIGASKESAFPAKEELCFSYIASLIGSTLLRQSKFSSVPNKIVSSASTASSTSSISFGGSVARSVNKRSIFNLHNRVSDSSSKRSNPVESPTALQALLDFTYSKLDAERVSIFAYDATSKSLVCAVSLDVKGLSVPADAGILGRCFSTGKIINLMDVSKDPLHYKEVDLKSGFQTRSLLSVPINDGDGRTVGVVQALNKRAHAKFNEEDERMLTEVGAKYFYPILNKTILEEGDDRSQISRLSVVNGINTVAIASSAAATIGRYIVDMLKCRSVEELLLRAEHSVKSFIQASECDSLAVYFAEKDLLARAGVNRDKQANHPYLANESMNISDLPNEVKDALQNESVIEFYSTKANELQDLLPDLSVYQALIVPIKANIRGMKPFSCVLVYNKSTFSGCVPFSPTTKDLLSSFSACFSCALEEILDRAAIEDHLKALQSNLGKVSNTLRNLQEVIILLNSEGNVLMCNKNVGEFLGIDSEDATFPPLTEGEHFSFWFNAETCPQLVKDIESALTSGRLISREEVLVNVAESRKLFIDYRIVAIDKKSTVDPSSQISAVLITIQISKTEEASRIILKTKPQSTINLLVNPAIALPSDIFEWEFNALKVGDKAVLCNVIGKFFESLVEDFGLNYTYLANYIVEISERYHDRPFHNFQHSATVTHFTYMLLKTINAVPKLPSHIIFSLLLSALVHDVDHPGNTNLFEVNTKSELALLYNDQAVLENHHCSVAFRLMRQENMQILSGLSRQIETDIRKFVVSSVLATDMSQHFDLVEEIKKRPNGWSYEEVKDQLTLGKVIVHAADLSNPVRPFNVSVAWARRISAEFNEQVAKEEALGLPVLGFMVSKDDIDFCRNEIGFSSFVVAPMWRAIKVPFPEVSFLVDQMVANLVEWKQWGERLKEEVKEEESLN